MSNYLPAGVTDREIDAAQLDNSETVPCAQCHADIDYYSKEIVEAANALGTKYFCNHACRAKMIWEETYTVTGRADLLRIVAALHLLMEAELHRMPAVTIYGADEILANPRVSKSQHIDLRKFREHALAFLEVLSPDGCAWSSDAQDAAGDFAGQLSAKAVASFTKNATSGQPVKEAHDAA
jgi:hypothetical protein